MLTSRDHEVIEFVKTFKIARTDTIKELFFPSLSACQKRLKSIYEQKELYRVRDVLTKDYLYYLSKPTQLKHSLLLSDFYRELHK
jgi:hypothetical protein